jgi:N-acetylneuraminic acid mutarotase
MWRQLQTTNAPPVRRSHTLTYDAFRNRTVLFGGFSAGTYLSDTWVLNGSTWTQLAIAGPSARREHAAAYDAARQVVVLFGGSASGGAFRDDTWEFDGSTWLPRTPTRQPPARDGHSMVWDSNRQRVVLFGGTGSTTGSTAFDDVWEWDGTSWTPRVLSATPPARYDFGMAYDSFRQRVIVAAGGRGYKDDVWEWDGGLSWAAASTFPGDGRELTTLSYLPSRRRTVLFGGVTTTGPSTVVLNDTWEWDGTTWVLQALAVRPPPVQNHAMTYDDARGRALLFGGSGSDGGVWEYGP